MLELKLLLHILPACILCYWFRRALRTPLYTAHADQVITPNQIR